MIYLFQVDYPAHSNGAINDEDQNGNNSFMFLMKISMLINGSLIMFPKQGKLDSGVQVLTSPPAIAISQRFLYTGQSREAKLLTMVLASKCLSGLLRWQIGLDHVRTSAKLYLKQRQIPVFLLHSFCRCLEPPSLFLYEKHGRRKRDEKKTVKQL